MLSRNAPRFVQKHHNQNHNHNHNHNQNHSFFDITYHPPPTHLIVPYMRTPQLHPLEPPVRRPTAGCGQADLLLYVIGQADLVEAATHHAVAAHDFGEDASAPALGWVEVGGGGSREEWEWDEGRECGVRREEVRWVGVQMRGGKRLTITSAYQHKTKYPTHLIPFTPPTPTCTIRASSRIITHQSHPTQPKSPHHTHTP